MTQIYEIRADSGQLQAANISMPLRLRVVNWNVEWARVNSDKGIVIKQRIDNLLPHVVCLTESHSDYFTNGHFVTSEADYGYGNQKTKRKVVLWSSSPWTDVDYGVAELPSGRFVGATTVTPLGEIRFLGVCIPWKDAHVRNGRGNRQPWEDHGKYLEALPSVAGFRSERRLILVGDFNQTIPKTRAPVSVFDQLRSVISPFQIATEGALECDGGLKSQSQPAGGVFSKNTSLGVRNPRHARGRLLSRTSAWRTSAWVMSRKSVPLGKYWRSNPFVFSFVPR